MIVLSDMSLNTILLSLSEHLMQSSLY